MAAKIFLSVTLLYNDVDFLAHFLSSLSVCSVTEISQQKERPSTYYLLMVQFEVHCCFIP